MKKILIAISVILASFSSSYGKNQPSEPEIYLLTILPGSEIYSIYGHSALRIVMPDRGFDNVFNWGVFDFSTPNFGYKFAKGRLNYMLAAYSYERFLQEYFLERRTVISQRVLLEPEEKEKLIALAFENLKPENVSYLYDFFYDNCATRIRDILEQSVNGTISIPESKRRETPSFRELIDNYQKRYNWLDLGIDFLLGLPADKKASVREQMFLPDYLMANLSVASVVRESGSSELLEEPVTIHEFEPDNVQQSRYSSPMFILWAFVAIILAISLSNIKLKYIRILDILLFTGFSLMALLLVFSNFLTDHGPLKWNLNIIWMSPLIIFSLIHILFRIKDVYWFRFNLVVTTLFLLLSPLIPQSLNRYLVPVIVVIIVRLFFLSRFGKPDGTQPAR